MGKPTGFLEYARRNSPAQPPLERIAHFDEFRPPLSKGARMDQGARCMECGVPFCQSGMMLSGAVTGCPLHNLIPEWNDMLYRGNWGHALARLMKTNNFPEFTGRVCPAPCEAACTCGLNGDPVTIRENELAIVEEAFRAGLIAPAPPLHRTGRKVAVVGSGPAGLAVADQLNRRGHQVTVYERADRPGGLLMYGIPNMKLDKRVVARRIALMEKEGVTFLLGRHVGATVDAQALLGQYDALALCCGATRPRDLDVDGRSLGGVRFAVDFLKAATLSLMNGHTPAISAQGKKVVVVGGGDTGNDCVGTCIRQGCQSVVQLEMLPQPPDARADDNPWPQWPRTKKTDYGQQEAIAVFGSDPRMYQTTVARLAGDDQGNLKQVLTVALRPERDPATGRTVMAKVPGSEQALEADLLLIAAGFVGCEGAVPEALGVGVNARGMVVTAPGGYETDMPGVFAAGDMRRGQSLVVWAIQEGRAAARAIDAYLMGYTALR